MRFWSHNSKQSYGDARDRMVNKQLIPRGIHDESVLSAMRKLPRHEFASETDAATAYGDYPLSIGHGQTISQPYIVASMTQELRVDSDSRVLEIGTGCGYQTAVLAEIAQHVFSIEYIPELHREAEARLTRMGYVNITTKCGDGSRGWPEHAPFDAIIVTAAAKSLPQPLIDQLAENGRMLIPVESHPLHQELFVNTKQAGKLATRSLYGVRFVPLRTPED